MSFCRAGLQAALRGGTLQPQPSGDASHSHGGKRRLPLQASTCTARGALVTTLSAGLRLATARQ
eukprot:2276539-Pleurochrysis_carterae.AAC.1